MLKKSAPSSRRAATRAVHRQPAGPGIVFQTQHPAGHVWAMLSVLAFPIGMFAADRYGVGFFAAFFVGMATSCLILVIHFLTERRLWMFDPRWRAAFEHPDFTQRLVVVSAAMLLLIETALIIFFLMQPTLDQTLAQIIFARQCRNPSSQFFFDVCQNVSLRYRF